MTPRDNKEKAVAVFLAITFVVTSFFYVSQPVKIFALTGQACTPVGAVGPFQPWGCVEQQVTPNVNITVADLWGMFLQGVIKAAETAGYTIIRKYVRQGLSNLTKDVWKQLLTGGKGQEEMFRTEPWDQFWEQAGDEAFGSAIEGFAQGFQNEYEYKKQTQANQSKYKEELGKIDDTYKAKEVAKLDEKLADGGSLNEKKAALQSWTGSQCDKNPYTEECRNIQDTNEFIDDALKARSDASTDIGREKEKERFGFADKRDTEDKAAKLKANKADANLIAGNSGALSEASRVLVDVVCKPDPDIAFNIFLGLGDQIEMKKRKPICPLSTLKENWKNVVENTGVKLDEASIQGWNALAGLVKPDTSDLGAAWKLSVGGHSVSTIAKSLGEIGFLSEASVGQIKNLTDYSGKTATPASVIKSMTENSLKVQIEEDTRFIPTGHLLADLILTAGSTVLSTSLNILTEGLRKKKLARGVRKSVTGTAFSRLTAQGANNALYNPSADPGFGGVEAAEARLADFSKLDLSPPQDWNILSKLTSQSCPENMQGGGKGGDIDACVMDDKFAEAVKERITVKEAISRNLLNPDGVFGFDIMDESEPRAPSWQRNFPYRSLVIMRKYRVLPVSWELAALYIQSNKAAAKEHCGGKNCTLRTLIEKSKLNTSPFYGMIDENWVLKIPPVLCVLKGYGSEIQSQQEMQECDKNDPTKNCRTVTKSTLAPEQCVDYQTCLQEDEEGQCSSGRYGYCLQEQKIIRFKGEKCEKEFSGCESFRDVQTNTTAAYLKQSLQNDTFDLATGECTYQNAGCQWYSSDLNIKKPNTSHVELDSNLKAKAYELGTVRQEWNSDKRAYFSSSAQKCDAENEGCRQVSGPVGTPSYLRLPPKTLECDKNGVKEDEKEVPWYKREDCKQYTQLCKEEYVGCQQYIPENDTVAVTGMVPGTPADIDGVYRCPAACTNIYNYAEKGTLFDTGDYNPQTNPSNHARPSLYFNSKTARACSVADAGCEEFTNLDAVSSGGEGREYYTYLQRCEKVDKVENISASEVFYSFVGSDTGGGQPEKYYLVGATRGDGKYAPVRIDSSETCDKNTIERQKYDPRSGTNLCREFFNASGDVFYEWTNNLIYRTTDCASYRRTIEGSDARPYTYSRQFSRTCSAKVAGCREYRAPQAGNVRVVSYDNFEETIGEWKENYSSSNNSSLSNEGETIGDHSVVMKKSSGAGFVPVYRLVKPFSYTAGKEYQLTFSMKGKDGAFVQAYWAGKNNSGENVYLQSVPGETALSNDWERISFGFQKETPDKRFKDTEIIITQILIIPYVKQDNFNSPTADVGPIYIDDIVIKEFSGIEYLIRDSWTQNPSCFSRISETNPEPDFNRQAYPNCSLYTDNQRVQHALTSFQRVCPNEMAGCVKAQVKGGALDGDESTAKQLKDHDMYIIPDEAKACGAENNKCTAYGSPKLQYYNNVDGPEQSYARRETVGGVKKELWNIAYYKVTPEEMTVAQNMLEAKDFSSYEKGICREVDVGCREYAAGTKDARVFFRAPERRVCQPPAAGEADGFYYTCEKTKTIVCSQDSDCSVIGGVQDKCNTKEKKGCDYYQQELPGSVTGDFEGKSFCSCDKNNNKLECTNVPAQPSDPAVCWDKFDSGSRAYKIINPSKSFARACPVSAAGCRTIKDPECKQVADTSNYTLRTDYGRGTAKSIPCTPEYYFTEDLDTRTKECNGKVSVEEGCLLLNDETKKTFEYTKATGAVGADTIGNPSLCSCDTQARTLDCPASFPKTELDSKDCYDRFDETDGGVVAHKLQKYTENQTDLKYDSSEYYKADKRDGSVNLGSVTPNPYPDANVLMKVKQDRQCKTWLKCTGFWKEDEREICFKRDLCDTWGEGNSCANTSPVLGGTIIDGMVGDVLGEYNSNTSIKTVRGPGLLPSLSGIARPDYLFPNTDTDTDWNNNYKTLGGYGYNFKDWRQVSENDVGDRSYSRLEFRSPLGSMNREGRNVHNIISSCRLHSQQTVVMTSPSELVDACRAERGSYGVYGFCLEPYPNYKTNYYGNDNYYRKVCTNNTDKECPNGDVDCPGGKCGFRYYENTCLTWMPVDRIENQKNLFTSQTGQEDVPFNQAGPLYSCVKKEPYEIISPDENKSDEATEETRKDTSFDVAIDELSYCGGGPCYNGFVDKSGFVTPPEKIQAETIDSITFGNFRLGKEADDFNGNDFAGSFVDEQGRPNVYYIAFYYDYGQYGWHFYAEDCGDWKDHGAIYVSKEDLCASFDGRGEVCPFIGDYCSVPLNKETLEYAAINRPEELFESNKFFKSGNRLIVFRTQYDKNGFFEGVRWRGLNGRHSGGGKEANITAGVTVTVKYNSFKANITQKKTETGEFCSTFAKVINDDGKSVPVLSNVISSQKDGTLTSEFINKSTRANNNNNLSNFTGRVKLSGTIETCRISEYEAWTGKSKVEKCSNQDVTPTITTTGGNNAIKVFDNGFAPPAASSDYIKWWFAKQYGIYYWKGDFYDDVSKNTALIGQIGSEWGNYTTAWWNDAKTFANTHPPIIYAETKTKTNDFVVQKFGQDRVAIRFYVTVEENQRPIKSLKIDWDDPGPSGEKRILAVAESEFDGRGIAAKSPPTTEEPINTFSGYGPFYYEYKGGSANKNICVTIKDNWDGETIKCKKVP